MHSRLYVTMIRSKSGKPNMAISLASVSAGKSTLSNRQTPVLKYNRHSCSDTGRLPIAKIVIKVSTLSRRGSYKNFTPSRTNSHDPHGNPQGGLTSEGCRRHAKDARNLIRAFQNRPSGF